ncbi:MAG: histidinol dehydrogenase [Prevotellaceae bacterium]|nr:histidinol dehydrogenase [Prevotellaceae bacterium]
MALINVYIRPDKAEWAELLRRPVKDASQLSKTVGEVLRAVKEGGDEALRAYERRFDHVELQSLVVTEEEMEEAERQVSKELREAMELAHRNIATFHRGQAFRGERCLVAEGVECWQKSVPIEKVGLYIPGGTAPLFSTVLMLATPARIAGCREIVLCSPPSQEGRIHPAILVAARIAGVGRVFKLGGVQAIAAMAYGTESVPRVFKILGPGNQYVTCAKQMVSPTEVAIDMPAGPSEVMVLADASSNAAFVASDLLSQAEHGVDSQVLMLTTDEGIVEQVQAQVDAQLRQLPRREIAAQALRNSRIVVLRDDGQMMEMANLYAPEHLIIETRNYKELALKVVNAGSVFLGSLTPESAGDYASGTNHTLPTNGYATAYSGVNLDTFCRKITFQHINEQGIRSIGRAVEVMAEAESLDAHRLAMELRRLSL